jgi:hypothetical protein
MIRKLQHTEQLLKMFEAKQAELTGLVDNQKNSITNTDTSKDTVPVSTLTVSQGPLSESLCDV